MRVVAGGVAVQHPNPSHVAGQWSVWLLFCDRQRTDSGQCGYCSVTDNIWTDSGQCGCCSVTDNIWTMLYGQCGYCSVTDNGRTVVSVAIVL